MKKFSESHEWVDIEGQVATIGITEYAQKELGDIVYVELPVVGHRVTQGEAVVVVESTKAAVDIYTPVRGEILSVNTSLREHPEKVNLSAESEGWFLKLQIEELKDLDFLMDEASYRLSISKK